MFRRNFTRRRAPQSWRARVGVVAAAPQQNNGPDSSRQVQNYRCLVSRGVILERNLKDHFFLSKPAGFSRNGSLATESRKNDAATLDSLTHKVQLLFSIGFKIENTGIWEG